ncbi:uncharacterized protein BXZ73DRAFT_109026 [Epithele typhae]|uniref:uncharacterized protein n=1 Tax=Epithele typhae TaxID=378194 RepID=UPI002008D123|nr:uncharacterized protein BXZ73DRAFT_109026 [Epithele typhae]KAH9910416.1 hypothetical protein BXZ73DRAFT_109026 [Epithele typhae]
MLNSIATCARTVAREPSWDTFVASRFVFCNPTCSFRSSRSLALNKDTAGGCVQEPTLFEQTKGPAPTRDGLALNISAAFIVAMFWGSLTKVRPLAYYPNGSPYRSMRHAFASISQEGSARAVARTLPTQWCMLLWSVSYFIAVIKTLNADLPLALTILPSL